VRNVFQHKTGGWAREIAQPADQESAGLNRSLLG